MLIKSNQVNFLLLFNKLNNLLVKSNIKYNYIRSKKLFTIFYYYKLLFNNKY